MSYVWLVWVFEIWDLLNILINVGIIFVCKELGVGFKYMCKFGIVWS